jgi:transcriptional regulator with XRE-family HTH domain
MQPSGFRDRLIATLNHLGLNKRGIWAKIAKRLKVSGPTATGYNKGTHMPEFAKVQILARDYGVDAEWLYSGKGTAPAWWHANQQARSLETEPEPEAYRGHNDIKALQWIVGALVGYRMSREPGEAENLLRALEQIPEEHRVSGPGGALLAQIEEMRKRIAEEEAPKPGKRRGSGRASRRIRS